MSTPHEDGGGRIGSGTNTTSLACYQSGYLIAAPYLFSRNCPDYRLSRATDQIGDLLGTMALMADGMAAERHGICSPTPLR